MSSLVQAIADAQSAFESLDYDTAAAHLQTAAAGASAVSVEEVPGAFRRLLGLLRTFEATHAALVARSEADTAFIVSPYGVLNACSTLLSAISERHEDPIASLSAAYIHYLRRELDAAVTILAGLTEPLKSDVFFWQTLATCQMLRDEPESALAAAESAARIDAKEPETRRLLDRIQRQLGHRHLKPLVSGRWMPTMLQPEGIEESWRRYVLADHTPGMGWLTPSSRVVAIGSCFANNIASALQSMDVSASSFSLAEEINNTFTNLEVFRLVAASSMEGVTGAASGVRTTVDPLMTDEFVAQARKFHQDLVAADVLVYTLGVSQGFFDADGAPLLIKGTGGLDRSVLAVASPRFIEPEENVANVLEIVRIARSVNSRIKVVLTLSPVPLARSFGMKSAVMADAVSKSSLRMAVHTLTGMNQSDLLYWPSFEMSKWLAPHTAHSGQAEWTFGAEDHYSRHVSRHTVALIVKLFIEYLS